MKRIVLALVALSLAVPSFAACNYNFDTPACFTSTVDMSAATVIGGTSSGTSAFEDITVSDDCTITDDLTAKDIDAGASGNVGTIDVYPATASKGKLTLACTDQTGNTTVTLTADAMGQASNVHIPDPGAAASYLAQSTAALTLAEVDVLQDLTATKVEIQNECDISAQLQAITSAGAVTVDGTKRRATLSGGAYAITLAAPGAAAIGAVLVIEYTGGDTDAVTLALTNVIGESGGTTATFNADGEGLVLIGTALGWVVLAEFGGVTLA
jgi:hypothetical protein